MKSRRYNAIDFWKLIMAFFVVSLHIRPLENCGVYVVNKFYDVFAAMAVPFFFLAAGFLLAQKMGYPMNGEDNRGVILDYLKKILKLYIIWSVVYLPLAVIHYIAENRSPITSAVAYVRGLLFVGEHYNSWHLWYLLSTVYALVFVLLLLKKNQSIERIAVIGFCIFLLSVGITHLTDNSIEGAPQALILIKRVCKLTINNGRILTGMFYLPMGMMLARKKGSLKVSWIVMVVSIALDFIVNNPTLSALLAGFSSIGFFIIVSQAHYKDSPVFYVFRKMSTVIYFNHMLVWSIFYTLVYGEKTYGMGCYLVTLLISCIISLGFIAYLRSATKEASRAAA